MLGRQSHGQLALQSLDLVLQGEGDPLVEQLGPLVVRRAAAQREQRGEVERRAEDDVDGRAWGQLGIGLGSGVVRSGLALRLGRVRVRVRWRMGVPSLGKEKKLVDSAVVGCTC